MWRIVRETLDGAARQTEGTSLARPPKMSRNIVEENEPKQAPVEEPHSELDLSSLLLKEDDLYDNMPCTD